MEFSAGKNMSTNKLSVRFIPAVLVVLAAAVVHADVVIAPINGNPVQSVAKPVTEQQDNNTNAAPKYSGNDLVVEKKPATPAVVPSPTAAEATPSSVAGVMISSKERGSIQLSWPSSTPGATVMIRLAESPQELERVAASVTVPSHPSKITMSGFTPAKPYYFDIYDEENQPLATGLHVVVAGGPSTQAQDGDRSASQATPAMQKQ